MTVPARRNNRHQQVISARKRNKFLTVLRQTGKVGYAAQCAGYADSSYLRRLRDADEDFAKEWDEALITAADDILEPEAIRRAVDGTNEPVFYRGNVVGFKKNYSDQLLMFLLRGAKPEKFRDNMKLDARLEGKFGVIVLPMTAATADDWEADASGVHVHQKTLELPARDESGFEPAPADAPVTKFAGRELSRV